MISDIDLPTEATILEKEELVEPEKLESFAELYEKYDEQFIKNANTEAIIEGENPLQKRNLPTDVDDIEAEENSKAVKETIEKIVDPEIRKEFEQELSNGGQPTGGESAKSTDTGTEYDPNYAAKVISSGNVTEKFSNNIALTGKEALVEDHEAALVRADAKMPDADFITEAETEAPKDFTSLPELIEVVEQILHLQDSSRMSEETTADPPSVRVEVFDPIVVLPKDRDSFRSIGDEVTTVPNDKFVGFEPTDDLVQPGEETTERDHFFKKPKDSSEKAAEMLVDTFEFMAIYGKSLNDESGSDIETSTVADLEEATTVKPFVESKTEIVEVRTEISVSFESEETSKAPEIKDDVKSELVDKSMKPEKIDEPSKPSSSEESNSSKSDEKKDRKSSKKSNESSNKSSDKSTESSEENNAKEVFDVDSKLPVKDTQHALVEDLLPNPLNHEVIKKDHPADFSLAHQADLSLPNVAIPKSFNVEEEIARHLEEKLKPEEPTTVGIFDTLEDIVTTVSDGIKLSNEFRASIDSFRGHVDENKTVLDTNSEAISSKNIANSLVNIAEEMTLEDHIESARSSGLYGALIVLASTMTLVVLCVIMVKRFARMGVSLRLH